MAAVCVGLLAALAAVELALRVTGFPASRWLGVSDAVQHHVHATDVTYSAGALNVRHTIRFDHDGLPFDPALRVAAASARARLALMGDSFVEAVDVPYEASLAGRLEQHARSDTAVRNYGVWSYSPVLHLLQWRRKVRDFHPTHVVLVLFNNDIADDAEYYALARLSPGGDLEAVPAPGRTGIRGVIGRSRTARLAAYGLQVSAGLWQRRREGFLWGDDEAIPEISALTGRMLLTLDREIRDAGGRLWLTAVPPRTPQPPPTFWMKTKAWADAHGIPTIDLAALFRSAPADGPPLVFPGDIHWTAEGHRLAADAVRRALPDLFDDE